VELEATNTFEMLTKRKRVGGPPRASWQSLITINDKGENDQIISLKAEMAN
jgi:hypothetical protein